MMKGSTKNIIITIQVEKEYLMYNGNLFFSECFEV